MDYRLTDPYLDPPDENDADYTERSIRLAHTFWCLDREAMEGPEIPEVNDLPALERGYITFGCFNNFCKVNQPLLELWKRVLDTVANSRFVLLRRQGRRRIGFGKRWAIAWSLCEDRIGLGIWRITTVLTLGSTRCPTTATRRRSIRCGWACRW